MKRVLFALLLIAALLMTAFGGLAQEDGGTFVLADSTEPATLDPQRASGADILRFFGATLVAKDPQTNAYVPYLAESWTASEDGLTWDFTLREGVKFHDGTDFTAQDYVYTFERWFAPETASPTASTYGVISSAEAIDDYTLRLNLASPFYALLELLATPFAQPLSQEAVEAAGDQFGQQPVGVGPFRVAEWLVGDRLVLERNPDYNWAPPFVHEGAPYLDQIIIRFIPEYSTILSGLQSGEIDSIMGGTNINGRDVPTLEAAGFSLNSTYVRGMLPFVLMNVSQPPFDDINVRQAFNLAIDKDAFVAVAGPGTIPQYGPISLSVAGYWPGVEEIGYRFDLEQAQQLMADAGYTANDAGTLEKDGEPFSLTLYTIPDFAPFAQVLQAMYAALGVELQIEQADLGVLFGRVVSGDYQIAVGLYDFSEADVMYIFYHSSGIGGFNISQVSDPTLDEILSRTRTETDPELRQQAVNEAQQRIVEQAYVAPIITLTEVRPISARVQDIIIGLDGATWFNDVTISE